MAVRGSTEPWKSNNFFFLSPASRVSRVYDRRGGTSNRSKYRTINSLGHTTHVAVQNASNSVGDLWRNISLPPLSFSRRMCALSLAFSIPPRAWNRRRDSSWQFGQMTRAFIWSLLDIVSVAMFFRESIFEIWRPRYFSRILFHKSVSDTEIQVLSRRRSALPTRSWTWGRIQSVGLPEEASV